MTIYLNFMSSCPEGFLPIFNLDTRATLSTMDPGVFYMKGAAIYPGTFDPPTLGHLNMIQRAASKFDKLVIGIGKNCSKTAPIFSVEERVELLQKITWNLPSIEIAAFNGLLVDFAKTREIDIITRSIRTILDFESETLQAHMNRQLG